MRPGWIISAAAHGALLALAIWGGIFARDRIPEVTVADVAVISEAEFAALTAPEAAPDIAADDPEVALPEPDEAAPEPPAADDAPTQATPAAPVETPDAPEATPEALPEPLPPEAAVEDNAPTIETPDTLIDGSTTRPDAVAQPVPRVAPIPQVAPPPMADVAPERVDETVPDPDAEPDPEITEDAPPAAPEEASDRIVTEAEEVPDAAPATSMRPRSRPSRPVRVAEPDPAPEPDTEVAVAQPDTQPEPEPDNDQIADAIADAVADSLTPAPETNLPAGQPLTGGEKDAFRFAVQQCWTVDPGAQSSGVVVVVGFSLDRQGRIVGDVRRLSASGGDDAAQRAAFEKARIALLRCGRNGYDLPADKYARWQDVEMTFNPQGMQMR